MTEIKIGVAGWSYDDWNGIVYPNGLPSGKRLEYLAHFFDLIEINSSFYGHIRPAVGKRWCQTVAAANPRFIFTAKLNRAFTHSPIAAEEPTSAKTIRPEPTDERDAKAGLDSLADHNCLGAVLIQFPISFKRNDENQAYVEALVSKFRKYPLVLEVRHASWNTEEVLGWLAELGVGLCNIDQPLLGRAIRPGAQATSAIGYIRLHGRNYKRWFAERNVRDRYNFLYSPKELGPWKDRIEQVAEKTEKTFVVTNNHNLGKAAVNALELTSMLENRMVEAPPSLVQQYPELKPFTFQSAAAHPTRVDS
jgi:uncharacterized protein YecE (DUF72 family)